MFYFDPDGIKLIKKGTVIEFYNENSDYYTESIRSGDRFLVKRTAPVNFKESIIIPGNSYIDIDFSNSNTGLKLYPTNKRTIYQVLISFIYDDNTIAILPMIPLGSYLFRLEDSTMYPEITDPIRVNIGAIYPSDSKYPNYNISTIFNEDLEPFYLRLVNTCNEDVKLTFKFIINKLYVEKTNETPNMIVDHYTMFRW